MSLAPAAAPVGAAGAPGNTTASDAGGGAAAVGGAILAELDGTALAEVDAERRRYVDDGTLYKPVAVDTTIQTSAGMLQHYKVREGDTLTGIANRFGVSMMTVWWANKITSKESLKVGQDLVIPPVNGLVVTVKTGDTLESLAAANKIDDRRDRRPQRASRTRTSSSARCSCSPARRASHPDADAQADHEAARSRRRRRRRCGGGAASTTAAHGRGR